MKIKPYVRKVNYYETDRMAIVHHSNYIRYFEEARIDAMEQIDCDCMRLENMNLIIPVVDVYAKYHKSLGCGDEFAVYTKMTYFNGVKMEFDYEIRFTKDNALACTGHSAHCFVNENHRPITIRKSHPDIYEKMMALVE
ncbi:MAG: acyl-CoA thioesterase [Ruminococcus sp.]